MTEYSDIPQVNALYSEQQQLQSAIDLINAGGTLSYITITPPPPTEPVAQMTMAVGITITGPIDQATMDAIETQLKERRNAITDELAALGITDNTTSRN